MARLVQMADEAQIEALQAAYAMLRAEVAKEGR
jgi:hypothetical protein